MRVKKFTKTVLKSMTKEELQSLLVDINNLQLWHTKQRDKYQFSVDRKNKSIAANELKIAQILTLIEKYDENAKLAEIKEAKRVSNRINLL